MALEWEWETDWEWERLGRGCLVRWGGECGGEARMCGILAIMGVSAAASAQGGQGGHAAVDGGDAFRRRALELSSRLRHRGPDWSGIHVLENADGTRTYLCHERLAIVDPSSGDQPLFGSTKDIVVTVNGEIYNHVALKEDASLFKGKAHTYVTGSDCEVIPHLYEEVGSPEEVCAHLDGMFAFTLVDRKKGTYFAARDAFGKEPMYIGYGPDGSVWVASECKAIKDDVLRFEAFPPGCIYSSEDAPGTFRRWFTPRWWEVGFRPAGPADLGRLRALFVDAVRKRMMSDVPFGVLLSGGLDSSLVAAVAQREITRQGGVGLPFGGKLHSFCIGLEGSPDLAAAQTVADFLGTRHHGFTFTVQEGIDAIRDVIYHLETFDTTTVRASTPMFLMSRKIKSMGVKMVLSGEGSDEIFGGYLYFHKCPDASEFHEECVRKVKALHQYDCLRANKSTHAWGLEARCPFLDKELVRHVMEDFGADAKMCVDHGDGHGSIEKWLIRSAFDTKDDPYLPESVLWRQKEQFSDGVGYSWIDGLKAHAETIVSDKAMAAAPMVFEENPPLTKEAYLYRSIFEGHFPQASARRSVPGGPSVACSTPAAIKWDATFALAAAQDPSGRSVAGVHADAYCVGSGTEPSTKKARK